MARPKKTNSSFAQINLSESFTSLFLGGLVVLIATFFVFIFAKNRAQISYEKINTAVSTHQEVSAIKDSAKNSTSDTKFYEIKSGENLWTIAEKVYGSGYNWVDLAKANNLRNPGLILAGNKLIIPVVQRITVATIQPMQNNGPSISGSNYKIVKGDNLWDISVRKYGDGFKWPEIARANNIPNPDLIYADNTLKLPQ